MSLEVVIAIFPRKDNILGHPVVVVSFRQLELVQVQIVSASFTNIGHRRTHRPQISELILW